MMSRQDIFRTHPQKCFFALFDFDDAYQDWRSLGGAYQITDIGAGLCRKLDDKNAFAFLLPIPDNPLRSQVWDEGNQFEKIRPKPHFCIEHLFWDVPGLDGWFRTKNGIIKFRSDDDKVRFAEDVDPGLEPERFNILRPMLDFIAENGTNFTAATTRVKARRTAQEIRGA